MSDEYVRYAIWWVPQEATALAGFGMRWTGWCAEEGDSVSLRRARSLPRSPATGCCQTALRGLHGTLAVPFTLGPGRSVWRLERALCDLADTMPAVPLPRLEVTERGSRVVLAPVRESGMLQRLQGRVADIVRLISGVSATPDLVSGTVTAGGIVLPVGPVRESDLVEPFEMPLTGPLRPREARGIAADLRKRLASLLAVPSRIGDVALMADPGRGRRWRLLERYRLTDEPMSTLTRMPAGMTCPDGRPLPPLNAVMGSDWETVIA